jgi:hypothetical protein
MSSTEPSFFCKRCSITNRTEETAKRMSEQTNPSLGVREPAPGELVIEDQQEPVISETDFSPSTVEDRLAESQEKTRDWVIKALIIALGLTFLAVFALIQWGSLVNKGETLSQSIITTMGTLVGTALGYYFGRKKGT